MPSERVALIRDLKEFISFNTVSSKSNATFARRVGQILKQAGFKVTFQTTRVHGKKYVNVLGRVGQGRRPLLITSHLDTVPSGHTKKWTRTHQNPWKAVCHKGRIFGLGAADDKGPLLAMLRAAQPFLTKPLKRPLVVGGTFGEEDGMGGARLLMRKWRGPKPIAIVAGEPTSLKTTYRHKGMGALTFEITSNLKTRSSSAYMLHKTFHGKQGHSARPWTGKNAIMKAVRFLQARPNLSKIYIQALHGGHATNVIPAHAELSWIESPQHFKKTGQTLFPVKALFTCTQAVQRALRRLNRRKDLSLHPPMVTSNLGKIVTHKNKLTLVCDFRLLPGQSIRHVYGQINRDIQKRFQKLVGVRCRVTIERDNDALGLTRHHRFVKCLTRILKHHGPVKLMTKPSCTEAGIYATQWKVPSIVFGPGESIGNIHSPNEVISVRALEGAVKRYHSIIEAICVKGVQCS